MKPELRFNFDHPIDRLRWWFYQKTSRLQLLEVVGLLAQGLAVAKGQTEALGSQYRAIASLNNGTKNRPQP